MSESLYQEAFARNDGLGVLFDATRTAMQTHGYAWRPGKIYGEHNGLPLAENSVRYGVRLTGGQARRVSREATEVLGVTRGLDIDYHEPFYLYGCGSLVAGEIRVGEELIGWSQWEYAAEPAYLRATVAFTACKDPGSGIEAVHTEIAQDAENPEVFLDSCQNFYAPVFAKRAIPCRTEDEDARALDAALENMAMLTADEYKALTVIVNGINKLWYVRPPKGAYRNSVARPGHTVRRYFPRFNR